jgi:excisionase family DNA binding protein
LRNDTKGCDCLDEVYYTSKELSGILKVSLETIRKKLRNNEIKGVKVGSKWRISKSSLNNYMLSEDGMSNASGCGVDDRMERLEKLIDKLIDKIGDV